jgi:glyoxylase-like metal-dependent hydrolase (beta-lactamase superfamily II)
MSGLSYILLTHIHIDHAGGAGTLANQFAQLQVLVHQRGARHLIEPSRLIGGTRQAYGEGFESTYGTILPVPESQVRIVEDKEIILLGEKQLEIIYAPGHAPHQMCIYDKKSKSLFSGEALGIAQIENSIVEPVAGFDFDAAVETIDRLSKLDLNLVLCSHGGACWEPARLTDSVRNNTKTCGEIILEAVKSGEGKEQISNRLKTYQEEQNTGKHQLPKRSYDYIIPWYEDYFRNKEIS